MGSAWSRTLKPSPSWCGNAAPIGAQKSFCPSRLMTVNARYRGWLSFWSMTYFLSMVELDKCVQGREIAVSLMEQRSDVFSPRLADSSDKGLKSDGVECDHGAVIDEVVSE